MEKQEIGVIFLWNDLVQISSLSKSARVLLDLFVLYMRDEDNLFYLCEGGMEAYIKYCKTTLNIEYSEKTVREAISELLKKEIIFRHYAPNNYIVNPRLYCKAKGFLRQQEIIEEIETIKKAREASKEKRMKKDTPSDLVSGNWDFKDFK